MGQEKKEAEIEAAAHASPLMTPDELAGLLRCSRRTVYDRVDKGELPGSLRIGRRLYFMREIVLGSLLEGTERRSWRIQ